jgi:DNA-directed RNA polymerase-3 subunit RPC5
MVRVQSFPIRSTEWTADSSIGQLHLHPINETYQLRPTLTYLDVYSQKSRHRGDDSDSDDGPPPDPDDPVPVPVAKEPKKAAKDAKEIQVAAKRGGGDDKGLGSMQGGLSQARREMLMIVRAEEDEAWVNYQVFGGEVRLLGTISKPLG